MKNLGIICGGFSSEFDISVKSATNIASNFPEEYRVFLIELNKDGWFVRIGTQKLPFNQLTFSFRKEDTTIEIDLALVYIHGDPGENGKIQAYLELIGVPYLNSGPLASQLSFDKWYCNQFLKGFGIKVADSVLLSNEVLSADEIARINSSRNHKV